MVVLLRPSFSSLQKTYYHSSSSCAPKNGMQQQSWWYWFQVFPDQFRFIFTPLSLSKLTYTDFSSLLKSLMFWTHKRFPAESKSKHAHVVKYIGYIGAFRKPILFLPDGRRDKAFQSTPVSNWRWHFSHLSTTPASATKMMVVLVPKISFSKEALLLFLKWKDFQKVSLDEFVCLDDKLT